jgi:murein DD-endopeptidase MepM/ murein hydrolase activator NlpD
MRPICFAPFLILCACAIAEVTAQEQGRLLNLALPTNNDALLRGDGPSFYQYIERDFQGVISTPWEGGQYGFVRNPVPTASGLVYTRFHEGIDIRPMNRDARGEPTDEVRAIDDGTVVYTNRTPGWSNYGNYIVVEHRWDRAPYYSLYAHLASVDVNAGQKVHRGERLAVMGHTGEGLNQARAHVHLELNLMLSRQFEAWHDANFKGDPNHHGIYNGINLAGFDIARLYLALRKRPSLTIPEFLAQEETLYKVTLPNSKHFELRERYPWMVSSEPGAKVDSWEVSFTRSGLPIKIEPGVKSVSAPELTYVKKGAGNYSYLTRGTITGSADKAALSDSGKRLVRLLIYPD